MSHLQGSQKLCIPYNPAAPLTVKKILRLDPHSLAVLSPLFFPHLPSSSPLYSQFNVTRLEKSPREVFNSEVQKDILILEEQEVRSCLFASSVHFHNILAKLLPSPNFPRERFDIFFFFFTGFREFQIRNSFVPGRPEFGRGHVQQW